MNKVWAICVAVLLSGCGGFHSTPASVANSQTRATNQQTFSYTGAQQSFTVPTGVTQITVTANGASGAGKVRRRTGVGGTGGLVTATIPVTPGETLAIFVGGKGAQAEAGGKGGFNGGGDGGVAGEGSANAGNGGGGASDVREGGSALLNRVVVAGGGGGGGGFAGGYVAGPGGNGGGLVGKDGGFQHIGSGPSGEGGGGGTQSSGGKGGASIHRGSFPTSAHGKRGKLGVGGNGGGDSNSGNGGGGGGGGYFGGGGGGAGSLGTSGVGGGGGGGGASSYVEPSATNVVNRRGKAPRGNGEIVINW